MLVSVNRTERKVTIEAGKKTVLLTGELVVEAKKGTPGWYTPYQGEEAKVTAAPPLLNSPLALFPGKYKVFYRAGGAGSAENLGEAEVKAGRSGPQAINVFPRPVSGRTGEQKRGNSSLTTPNQSLHVTGHLR